MDDILSNDRFYIPWEHEMTPTTQHLALLPFYPTAFDSPEQSRHVSTKNYVLPKVLMSNPIVTTYLRSQRMSKPRPRTESIHNLLKMPLDIIYEAFKHLHPVDVYHISIASRITRNLVVQLRSLWITTFAAHAEVPQGPSDMSKEAWAALLFGPSHCEVCGQLGTMLDFALLRRFCTICMGAELQASSNKSDNTVTMYRTGRFPPEMFDFVPKTFRWGGSHYYHSEHGRSSLKDLMEVESKLSLLHADIYAGLPGAEQAREDFVAAARGRVAAKMRESQRWEEWTNNGLTQLGNELYLRETSFRNRVRSRLCALGWDLEDLNKLRPGWFEERGATSCARLTRRRWRHLRPLLEADLGAIRVKEVES